MTESAARCRSSLKLEVWKSTILYSPGYLHNISSLNSFCLQWVSPSSYQERRIETTVAWEKYLCSKSSRSEVVTRSCRRPMDERVTFCVRLIDINMHKWGQEGNMELFTSYETPHSAKNDPFTNFIGLLSDWTVFRRAIGSQNIWNRVQIK